MKAQLKRISLIIIFVFTVFWQIPSMTSADDYLIPTEKEKLTYMTADNRAVITGCDPELTILIIPSVIDGCVVTGIAQNAFAGHESLIAAVIPQTVTAIGQSAFSGCISLELVTIGNGVLSIGTYAFNGCISLTDITVPDSVTEIEANAFYGCSSLRSVSLPFVGRERGNNNAPEATIGYIFGKSAFDGSTHIITHYSGGNVSEFYIPSSLRSVTITDETVIAHGAFENCTMLTSVTLNDSVTEMNNRAFYGCTGLENLPVPSGVTVLSENIFAGCSSLPSALSIPSGIARINSYAFRNCTGITSLTVPESVTYIEEGAFSGCSSLESITLPFVGAQRGVTETVNNTTFGQIFGSYGYDGGISVTMNHNQSNARGFFIPKTLRSVTVTDETVIPYGAFDNCSMLTSITYPDTVASIGGYAFRNCTGVSTLAIPSNISILEQGVFSGCTGLPQTLVIPGNIEKICTNAFLGCTNLTSVTIPESVTEIELAAFRGCSSLETMTLPFIGKERGLSGSREAIFGYIFGSSSYDGGVSVEGHFNSSNVHGYFIPAGLRSVAVTDETVIPFGAFDNCSMLTSITYPDTVASIGGYAFRNCTGVSSLAIPSNISILEQGVFSGCTGLPQTLVIPGNIEKICTNAFLGCTNLTSVTVPESVTEIELAAFKGCSSLEAMTLPFVGKERGNSGSREAIFGYIFGYSSYDGAVSVVAYFSGGNAQGYYVPAGLRSVAVTDETVIAYGAFENQPVTSITYNDNMTQVSARAFNNCSAEITVIRPLVYTDEGGEEISLFEAKEEGRVYINISLFDEPCEAFSAYVAEYDENGGLTGIKDLDVTDTQCVIPYIIENASDTALIKTMIFTKAAQTPLIRAYELR